MDDTFYVVYDPKTIKSLFGENANMPSYMAQGYYISGFPYEPWNIKFKGSYFECYLVALQLSSFTLN